MKKKVLTALMTGVLTMSMVIRVFAGNNGSGTGVTPTANDTDVNGGVILENTDAKIKVEVPTLFAFVVNGSVSGDEGAVTSGEDGGITLPGVKVKVTPPSSEPDVLTGESLLSIETEDNRVMNFVNYSTKRDNMTGRPDKPDRVGLGVEINGFIENKGSVESRNHWTHVAGAKDVQGKKEGFKQYTISIDGDFFDVEQDGRLEMANSIALGAPDLEWIEGKTYNNMNASTKLAETGITKTAVFDVAVGGQKGQYSEAEQSAKVGTIVWVVHTDASTTKVPTAPENDYLGGN